jgi:hypothetical protein
MSKSPTPTSTLFPQVSRGESNDAAKGLLDDAGDSSGDEAHYAPRGDYAPPRPVTSPPESDVAALAMRRTGSEIDVANFGACCDGSPVPAIGFDEAPRTP